MDLKRMSALNENNKKKGSVPFILYVGVEPAAKGTGSFPATHSLTIARTVLEESKQ